MHNSLCFPMHTLPFQSHFYGGEKTLSPSHFSWLYFHQGRTGEGSLRIEKCCSCNTSKIAGFYLDWARKFWAFFCLKWKTKTLSDCRKKGEEREQRRKGGEKKRKQERKKESSHHFCWPFSFVLKVWLGSAMRILKVFSISPSSPLLLWTLYYLPQPPKQT